MQRKIHVVLKKEDIDEMYLDGKIAVVFDILLATTTITVALNEGAKEVIPVKNAEEAITVSEQLADGTFLLAGEANGKTIANFVDPYPSILKRIVENKTLILSTTNGTVAVKKATLAEKLYISSMLNMKAVADEILQSNNRETIVLICSGSNGQFCMEDFYGAGYMIHCLIEALPFQLTDSARASYLFYKSYENTSETLLAEAQVSKMLKRNHYEHELTDSLRKNIFSIVPYWENGKIVSKSL
ncbi:MAG TPA: 2-phosphosulfolactate phosphatase [Bacilli bacterium]|nr:2-phosphosulfolactate phosphatase [Bacilli bacterium]